MSKTAKLPVTFFQGAHITWKETEMWKNEYDHKIYDKVDVEVKNVLIAKRGKKIHIFRIIPFANPKMQQHICNKMSTGKSLKIHAQERISKKKFMQLLQVSELKHLGIKA